MTTFQEAPWAACHLCGKLVRTRPDSDAWQPSYHLDADGLTCHECLQIDPAAYLVKLEGHPQKCNTIRQIDPSDYGYVLVMTSLESGFHPGQDADPQEIVPALEERGISRYLFNLDSTGQSLVTFSLYIHESEAARLAARPFEAS